MQVDEDVGIPPVDQLDSAARLGGFELDVVPVDVETLTVWIPSYDRRSVLPGAILVYRTKAIIPVGIEYRNHNQDQTVEQRAQATPRQVSQQHLRDFLTLHFAAMDVCLDVNDRLTASMRS
jgi:hypothetical protein